MDFDADAWAAFFTIAQATQPGAPIVPVHGVVGRSITKAVDIACRLWGKYRVHLIPFLTQLAIAALDALLSAQTDINAVNPPGPE